MMGRHIISVIYPFRDKDPLRLRNSVLSLRKWNPTNFEVIVVDYGSMEPFKSAVKKISNEIDAKLIRTETEGLPWSRAASLNIGIRNSRGDLVVTTDIDMIFEGDILKESLKNWNSNMVIRCKPLWLPKTGNKKKAQLGDEAQLGGYLFTSRNIFEKIGGFDERIKYWGLEDIDCNNRMLASGYKTIWIEDRVTMYHVWHPFSYGPMDERPISSWFDSSLILIENVDGTYRNDDFGKITTVAERPILQHVKEKEPYTLKVKSDNYINYFRTIVEEAKEKKFIKLILGPRFIDTRWNWTRRYVSFVNRIFRKAGYELTAIKNKNIDYFYLSLPVFRERGMVDYYIEQNMSAVYLLFR